MVLDLNGTVNANASILTYPDRFLSLNSEWPLGAPSGTRRSRRIPADPARILAPPLNAPPSPATRTTSLPMTAQAPPVVKPEPVSTPTPPVAKTAVTPAKVTSKTEIARTDPNRR